MSFDLRSGPVWKTGTTGNIVRVSHWSLGGWSGSKRQRLGGQTAARMTMPEPMQEDSGEGTTGDLLIQPVVDESEPMDGGAQAILSTVTLLLPIRALPSLK